MKFLLDSHTRKKWLPRYYYAKHESGAALIMVYLAILMFLYLAILFLDIPYMEMVGRSIQRAADSASLAGAVQLTKRSYTNGELDEFGQPTIQQEYRQQGWRDAKRAAFAMLRANEIVGIATSIVQGTPVPNGVEEQDQDTLDATLYGYENFFLDNGIQTGSLTIIRGVYERPVNQDPNAPNQIFFPAERGNPTRGTDPGDINSCIATDDKPSACVLPSGHYPIEDVADATQVTITVNNIPTLFAKLLGFNSFTAITRTATSGQM